MYVDVEKVEVEMLYEVRTAKREKEKGFFCTATVMFGSILLFIAVAEHAYSPSHRRRSLEQVLRSLGTGEY